MKSKKNILSITITIVLCLVFVAYGLVLAYHTNIKRNASREVNTVTTENSLLSNSIGTTEKKSGLVLQNTAFSNVQPIVTMPNHSVKNKFEFNVVKGTCVYNGHTIINTGVNSSSEQYLEHSEAYIYTKLQINNFDSGSFSTGKDNLNKILDDFQVDFFMVINGNEYEINVNDCQTESGRSCWDRFTKWHIDGTYHAAECTLNDDGSFYVAVRTVLSDAGSYGIRVKWGSAILDEFTITVKNYNDLSFENRSINDYTFKDNDQYYLYSPYYACSRWGYSKNSLMRLVTQYNYNNVENNRTFDNGLSPGSTIYFNPETDFPQQQDCYAFNNNCLYSILNTSYDLKMLLIYPNGEKKLVDLAGVGGYFIQEDKESGRKEKVPYYQFESTTHTIPSDWNEEEYKVTLVFFNEWCPMGQFYWTMTYTYKVDLITIDTEETTKQNDYFYIENSNVYSNVVLNMKNASSIDFNQIAVTFNCNGVEKPATGYVEYNGHYYYYTNWSTPDVYNGKTTVPVSAKVNYRGKTIANGTINLNLDVHDIDSIDEFKGYKVAENPLGYEDQTKALYQSLDNSQISGNRINFHGKEYTLGETNYNGIYGVYKDETMYSANKTTSSGKPIQLYNAIYNTNVYPNVINNNSVNMLAIYPEYNYDTSYGTLLNITQSSNQYKNAEVIDRCKNPSLLDVNAHAIPVWWNDGSYTINTLLFNVWLPVGPVYAYDSWSYNIQGSVYGDWYITRNKG